MGQTFLDLSGGIKTGELPTRLTKNQFIILLAIFLSVVITALAVAFYLHPDIKDNALFIALSFVATVFPCLYLLWQIFESNKSEQKALTENPAEKVVDTYPGPHQIPPPPQDFTGREDDIRDILASFDRGATITGLRGMGGVGKTALALVLAEKLAGRFPDGQILVEMKGTDKKPLSATEARVQVIRAYYPEFKIPPKEGELAGQYFSILHGKRTLLLLDNAASREQVEPLLPPKGSALLVTSRSKFALPGMKEKDLDVLPMEDAKKLLLEIAGSIGGHAEELAKLCGCLPLALRNAAYALKEKPIISVADYMKRLEDTSKRLELVDATFTFSYDLLTLKLRRLWCLLSVFPADFDLLGAAAVWAVSYTHLTLPTNREV